jgi:hypothetical protein
MRGGLATRAGGKVVDQAALDDHGALILDGELDLGFGVEGGGVGPGCVLAGEVCRGAGRREAVQQGKQQPAE